MRQGLRLKLLDVLRPYEVPGPRGRPLLGHLTRRSNRAASPQRDRGVLRVASTIATA